MNRQAQFTHYLKHKLGEFKYRLTELIDASDRSIAGFKKGAQYEAEHAKLVTYAFSALTSQVQTIKDILPVLLDRDIPWSQYKTVSHMAFIIGTRNSITHDGNPIINMWADGRFYISSSFVRVDAKGKLIKIEPPAQDVATICIEFTRDFSIEIIKLVEGVNDNVPLSKPIYGQEYFDKAIQHSAVPNFAREVYEAADKSKLDENDPARVSALISDLEALRSYSISRMPHGH